ncbi:hypothetical protein T10_2338 [Trichinella papuae]|uniref:Uncharacterized protein n=1 Tax=Trichinella papuae TaxID=268474 RepID=A0A0V1MFV8_9BILA|nr:hypothetical protein T10_2338 [Trichinella papuae]
MHCKSVGRKKLPFSTVGRSPEKFENHCSRRRPKGTDIRLYKEDFPCFDNYALIEKQTMSAVECRKNIYANEEQNLYKRAP